MLFVGTKKQARDAVNEWADRCGMPYVNQRWLGGLLTNFNTMSKRIERLHDLRELADNGQLDLLPTKERMAREAELARTWENLEQEALARVQRETARQLETLGESTARCCGGERTHRGVVEVRRGVADGGDAHPGQLVAERSELGW